MLAPLLAAAVAAALAAAPPSQPRAEGRGGSGDEPEQPAAPNAPEPAAVPALAEPVPLGARPRSWFLVPVLFWLPETKLGLAAAGGRDFLVDGSRRPSSAFLVAAWSIEGQGSVDGQTDVYLRDGSLLSVRARAVNYPDEFFGLGPSSPGSAREDFTRRFVELAVSGELATLDGRLRAGPRAVGRAEEVRDVVPGGRLATSGLPGLHGFNGLGVGGSVTWDTRDGALWPSQGTFAQAYYVRYPAALGRSEGFGKGAVDLRAFLPAGGARVLGLSAVLETTDGATPFTLLSKLGSPRFLRGYREGRYRDRIAWATQAELRVPIAGPLAATAFGAVGDVAPDLATIRVDRLKAAGGIGARWRLTPAGANLRADVAVGELGPEVYVILLEAF